MRKLIPSTNILRFACWKLRFDVLIDLLTEYYLNFTNQWRLAGFRSIGEQELRFRRRFRGRNNIRDLFRICRQCRTHRRRRLNDGHGRRLLRGGNGAKRLLRSKRHMP
jgi:hypothetical protein